MTHVLNNGRFVLKFALCDIEVQFVVEAFDYVDLASFEDVPALVVAIVGLVNGDLLALLLGCLRDIDEFVGVG